MRVRFYIEKRKGEGGKLLTTGRPIFMTVAFQGQRVLISTKQHVDLKWWNSEKQRVREIHSDAGIMNAWLDSLEHTAGLVWKSLVSQSENIEVKEFRKEFEKLKPQFPGGFFDVMYLFLEDGSMHWSSGSYKKVRTFIDQLRHFESETGYVLRFNTVTAEFLNKFQEFQQTQGKSAMTILKMVNTLVWFLNWATKKSYNVYSEYRKFYKMLGSIEKEEHQEFFYLEWDELMRFCRFSGDEPRKQRVKDVFCLMCFSGLRFAEMNTLEKEDLSEDFIVIRKLGRKNRHLPLNKQAKEIIAKYGNKYYRNNSALPPMSMVTMNKYLREIGEELKLNREVKDRNNSEIKVPLYTILTAGMAVQTFIFNAIRLEIPAEVISNYTGITNDQRIDLLKQEIAIKEIEKFNTI
ncbi:MAG: phage integrase SAM-like domain-containing protein [Bacteroidales bacterium]|jgi:site-specific recombinase XerD|nr:phage integrase SAM-like domain-containing protein [Bacteroidales bacterium]